MALTVDQIHTLISQTVADSTDKLDKKIDDLTKLLGRLAPIDNIEPYEDVQIDPLITTTESLELVKSLQKFDGENYISWRTSVIHCMKAYECCKGSSSYFTAVNILRNKIIGKANDVLTSHGTPLNVNAIIGRLDLTYEDKRPVHMLQTELSNARQGKQTLQQFYDQVSQLLTLITNKTIMSYGPRTAETNVLINVARENALRVFIMGLNQPMSNIVFSLNPGDLPNALARAQEIEVNQSQRFRDTNSNPHRMDYNRGMPQVQRLELPPIPRYSNNNNNNNNRQNFIPRQNNQFVPPPQRMDLSSGNYHPPKPQTNNNYYNQNRYLHNNPYRDQRFNNEIRNNNNPFKRDRPHSDQIPLKTPRLNNLDEGDNFLE